jgi:phage terminase Nu1 subunit (DNA packaging protein)
VRAGLLAVPSRVAARLPHLTAHDILEIDREIRAALAHLDGFGQQEWRKLFGCLKQQV